MFIRLSQFQSKRLLSSFDFIMMDVDKGDAAVENFIEEKAEVLEVNTILESYASLEGNAILEPYVGMKYESEDAALKFYMEYARRLGFVVRIMQCCPSGIDGRTLGRRLGCKKQGFSGPYWSREEATA